MPPSGMSSAGPRTSGSRTSASGSCFLTRRLAIRTANYSRTSCPDKAAAVPKGLRLQRENSVPYDAAPTPHTIESRERMTILQTLRSGHWPSLAGAWLHLTVSFMVWLLIGAMSISLAQELQLSDAEIAWLVALPL